MSKIAPFSNWQLSHLHIGQESSLGGGNGNIFLCQACKSFLMLTRDLHVKGWLMRESIISRYDRNKFPCASILLR